MARLVKVKSSLPLHAASRIVDAALAEARLRTLHAMTAVVLDSGGGLVCAKREDGSGIMRFDVAFAKAWGALAMGMPTGLLGARTASRPAFVGALTSISGGRLAAVPGGVLIVDEDGAAVGAVGASGDTGEEDEHCCVVGVRAAGLKSVPGSSQAGCE